MSLAAPLALLLLVALPLLVWLAFRARQPRELVVGTLLIWRRLAVPQASASQSRRRRDPLLYLLLAACAFAAWGAAQPMLEQPRPTPVLAVYVESLGPGEPGLDRLIERAREVMPAARTRVWFSGDGAALEALGTVNQLHAGPVAAELAQFERASADSDARLLFVIEPSEQSLRLGLNLPRADAPRAGLIFQVHSEGRQLFVRMSEGPPPKVEGADLAGMGTRGREFVREYRARDALVRIAGATQALELRANPIALGLGDDWRSQRHMDLVFALQPDGEAAPMVWLGGDSRTPAVRIMQGTPAELGGAETRMDWRHPLFRELPLAGMDLARAGRVVQPAPGERALAVAWRGDVQLGALATLSADGRVLRFAGDPFSELSATTAALLLDNAIGVLTGTRPTERPAYVLSSGVLPARRQAMAAPFEPQGEPRVREAVGETEPWAHVLLACAALLAVIAAGISASGPRQP